MSLESGTIIRDDLMQIIKDLGISERIEIELK